jgi:hypothetical protein
MMAINYDVKARIIDVKKDLPLSSDEFLVDTNVWFWLTYSRLSLSMDQPAPYQLQWYPSYIEKAIEAKATLYHTKCVFLEICSLIERYESDIFWMASHMTGKKVKEFRHLPDISRSTFIAEIKSVFSQISEMSQLLVLPGDASSVEEFKEFVFGSRVDGRDAEMAIIAAEKKIRIITDDGDFATCNNTIVHTANNRVVLAAERRFLLTER